MGSPYPPTFTRIAQAFASIRTQCWTTAQMSILDMLIDALADDLHDLNPRFNPELFKTVAHYRRGRIDN